MWRLVPQIVLLELLMRAVGAQQPCDSNFDIETVYGPQNFVNLMNVFTYDIDLTTFDIVGAAMVR